MKNDRKTQRDFVASGYIVNPGLNGSWIITKGGIRHSGSQSFYFESLIGFTDWSDMVEWIKTAHQGAVLAEADDNSPAAGG